MTLCLSTVYSFIACVHTTEYTLHGKRNDSRTLLQTALTCSQSSQLTLLFLVKTLELTPYLASNLSVLCNNNTSVPGSSCSERSGTANVRRNKARPQILWTPSDVMLDVFRLFGEGRRPRPPRFHHAALSWEPDDRMRCQFRRRQTCHSHPCSSANDVTFLEG